MAADDPWGNQPPPQRPVAKRPRRPDGDPHQRRMAEIAFDKANAKNTDMDPARVNEAAGKPTMEINADGSFTIRGVSPQGFFGPGQPMIPAAQDPDQGAIGRRFDYPVNYNQLYRPRATELVGFTDLRALADNLDVLRLVIETRKDQMEALDWTIRFRDEEKESDKDESVKKIIDFLRFPDREHSYSEWMRSLLEDLLVIDAPTIYPRLTNGGELYSLDVVDGAQIIPRLDDTGRRPTPPDVAYQQVLKGVVAVDYSANELYYKPRNIRSHKIYGYSAVEQIIVTVNIALRRQLFQLGYYTEGSIPDAFGFVPDTWTPGMIAEYQLHWDALFENPTGENYAQRRKMRWIPGAKDVKFAKEAILKDEFDEWLARVVCYAFSVEPTPFVKMMNRGTAGTQQEQSRSEGLLPMKKWWKAFMDYILIYAFKRPDLEYAWDEDEEIDPAAKAKINVDYVNAGILDPNEIRQELGKDPLEKPLVPPGQAAPPGHPDYVPPPPKGGPPGAPGAAPPDKPAAPAAPAAAADKIAKRKPKLGKPVNSDRRAVLIQTQRLTRAVKRQFRMQSALAIAQLTKVLGKATPKPEVPADESTPTEAQARTAATAAVDDIDLDPQGFFKDVLDPLQRTAADGAKQAYAGLGISLDADFVSEFSLEDARTRGAEMVGKKWVNDELVDNPNADWVIEDETRAVLQDLVTKAMTDGWSNDTLVDEIRKSTVFSPERAELVARTETAFADSRGHMAGWKKNDVKKVVWLTANDGDVSDDCAENGDAGAIDIGDEFPSGDSEPPAHPRCRCATAPVIDEGDEELEQMAPLSPELGRRMAKHWANLNKDTSTADAISKLAAAVAEHKTEIVINVPDQPTPNVVVHNAAPQVDVHVPAPRRVERVVTERDENLMIKRTEEREIKEPKE